MNKISNTSGTHLPPTQNMKIVYKQRVFWDTFRNFSYLRKNWSSVSLHNNTKSTTLQKFENTKKLPQLDQVWQGFSCNDDWASKRLRCLRFRCKKRGKEGEIARGLIPLKKNGKQGGESSVCNLFDWDLFNVGHSNCHLMRKQTTGIVKFLTLNLLSGDGGG